MKGARDQFFAGSGRAADQDRAKMWSDPAHEREHIEHGHAPADHVAELAGIQQLSFEPSSIANNPTWVDNANRQPEAIIR
jgi:hypothetical protein